jgi:2-hydroxy-3-oxopropionate reductase
MRSRAFSSGSTMATPHVAFIGLGIMGQPMAGHLLRAGYPMTVFNRTMQKAEPLRAQGARVAASVADAARQADVVITMLPDTPDVMAVLDGPEGVIANARSGAVLLDMSSISPVATKQLGAQAAERGLGYVDAPVSGGQKGAQEATLSIMVGGSDQDVARVRPILEVLGKTIVRLGPVGNGQVAKACNQIVVGVTIQALAEAFVLARKAGLEPTDLARVLGGGLARCGVLETRGPKILANDYAPGFRVRLHHKDLTVALETAAAYGVPVVATAIVREQMRALVASGQGDLDHTALVKVIERWAGVVVGSSA